MKLTTRICLQSKEKKRNSQRSYNVIFYNFFLILQFDREFRGGNLVGTGSEQVGINISFKQRW